MLNIDITRHGASATCYEHPGKTANSLSGLLADWVGGSSILTIISLVVAVSSAYQFTNESIHVCESSRASVFLMKRREG